MNMYNPGCESSIFSINVSAFSTSLFRCNDNCFYVDLSSIDGRLWITDFA